MGRFRYEDRTRPDGGVVTSIIDEYAESAKAQAKQEISTLLSDGHSDGDTAYVYRYLDATDVTVAYYQRANGENYWLIVDGYTDSVSALLECVSALHRPDRDDLPACYGMLIDHLDDDCDCLTLTE